MLAKKTYPVNSGHEHTGKHKISWIECRLRLSVASLMTFIQLLQYLLHEPELIPLPTKSYSVTWLSTRTDRNLDNKPIIPTKIERLWRKGQDDRSSDYTRAVEASGHDVLAGSGGKFVDLWIFGDDLATLLGRSSSTLRGSSDWDDDWLDWLDWTSSGASMLKGTFLALAKLIVRQVDNSRWCMGLVSSGVHIVKLKLVYYSWNGWTQFGVDWWIDQTLRRTRNMSQLNMLTQRQHEIKVRSTDVDAELCEPAHRLFRSPMGCICTSRSSFTIEGFVTGLEVLILSTLRVACSLVDLFGTTDCTNRIDISNLRNRLSGLVDLPETV